MLLNSVYKGIILNPKQGLYLECAYLEDVMCVLPMGYGKSLIFHLLSTLIFAKYKLCSDVLLGWRSKAISTVVNTIVIVVSPLNSLMSDQISRLNMSGIQASVIGVKESRGDQMANSYDKNMDDEFNIDIDFRFCQEKKLCDGQNHIVFAYPEILTSSKYGQELLLSKKYRDNVVAIVIEEVHCIANWLVYIEDITQRHKDMTFIFEW